MIFLGGESSTVSKILCQFECPEKGAKIGRPQATADDLPPVFLRHYPAFKNKQLNVSELARLCDISRTTAYKYIGLWEA